MLSLVSPRRAWILFVLLLILCVCFSVEQEEEEVSPTPSIKDLELAFYKVQNCYLKSSIRRRSDRKPSGIVEYHGPAVVLDDIIDETDASNLLLLNGCIKQEMPTHFIAKGSINDGGAYGNNDITFANEILSVVMPDLVDHILNATSTATETRGWLPHPFHLGFRCIEILEYSGSDSELKWHIDKDSIYTISIMLSSPDNFTGGSFVVNAINSKDTEKAYMTLSPPQYGGIIVDSETPHGVTTLGDGVRIVLVFELWPFEDAKYTDFRAQIDEPELQFKLPKLMKVLPTTSAKCQSTTPKIALTDSDPFVRRNDKNIKHLPRRILRSMSLDSECDMRDVLMVCLGVLAGLILGVIILGIEDYFLYFNRKSILRIINTGSTDSPSPPPTPNANSSNSNSRKKKQ